MIHYLLPGLGGTAALFRDYHFPFPSRALDWIAARKSWSLRDYAEAFTAHHDIQEGCTLVGVSMGGMLPCEISKRVPVSQIILVSSCTAAQQLNPLLTRLSVLAPVMPFGLMQRAPSMMFGANRKRVLAMFRQTSPTFLRWACAAAPNWEGFDGNRPLIRIHGDRDPVFPLSRQPHTDHLIRGGDHLMIISRRREINDLINANAAGDTTSHPALWQSGHK